MTNNVMYKELSLETILKESRWVAKMTYGRFVGTYGELECFIEDSENLRDIDLAAGQPEHLQQFCDEMWEHDRTDGWMTIQDFYNKVYVVRHPEVLPQGIN